MDEDTPDGADRSLYIGDGSPLSLNSLARIDLDLETYQALCEARERLYLTTREHLLARITPRERVFIEPVCLHPEQTDAEVMAALGLRESTVLAYYDHLKRNFNVRTRSELRYWAIKNHLVSMPDDDPVDDVPKGPTVDPPVKTFDPWVRWY